MIELTESNKPIGTQINPDLNICIVKQNTLTGEKTWYYAKNIVTNDGDLYYAQSACGETPTSDFSANAIIGGCIHVGGASPATSSKLLTHFDLTSFNKTTSDTLKIFVNHTFNGV